jgi:2-keto-4-pentenoate hydratase/2-oxohepta-3-ene-1,7-dioic acid hydratase in catechol pathway
VLCHRDDGDQWVDVAEAADGLLSEAGCPSAMAELLMADGPALGTARRVKAAVEGGASTDDLAAWPGRGARLAAPVPSPGSLVDFYAFEEHVRGARARRGLEIAPEWYRYPVYYRSNQRAILGPDQEAWFPDGEERMDYELELAAILGAPLSSPSPDEAEAAIAGYCLLNDWSARAIQAEVMKVGLGPAKGKDFATSLGPWLVTPDELGDLADLVLEARVNGEVWSRGTVGAMHWRWGEMLAFAADNASFAAGDVFGSGTVGRGCGLELDRYLQPGDVVELDGGEALGVLRGTVRQGQRGGRE